MCCDNLKAIVARIEERLKATGQSATAVSEAAGLSKDGIRNLRRNIEVGEADGKDVGTTTTTLLALAPVLKTTASWLLEGDRGAPPEPTAYRVTLPDGHTVLVEPDAVTPLFAREPTERR